MTTTFRTLGDPHLGKQFINNVPLHRRGERERMVWGAFEKGLDPQGAEVHICMGDLFDKAVVPYDVIMRAANLYRVAARKYPDTTFFVLRGNHDASRDLEAISAFDIFAGLVRDCENVEVVTDTTVYDGLLLCGWHPLRSAEELVRGAKGFGIEEFDAAFGHWDVDPRSDPFNLVPIQALKELGITQIYTGHDHLKRDIGNIHVVGSLLPYAHGEGGDMHVTLTLEEAKVRTDLHDKCVRIKLAAGEVYDLDLDCLQLSFLAEETEQVEVELGEFNLVTLFADCMTERAVPDGIREQVSTEWAKHFSTTP